MSQLLATKSQHDKAQAKNVDQVLTRKTSVGGARTTADTITAPPSPLPSLSSVYTAVQG